MEGLGSGEDLVAKCAETALEQLDEELTLDEVGPTLLIFDSEGNQLQRSMMPGVQGPDGKAMPVSDRHLAQVLSQGASQMTPGAAAFSLQRIDVEDEPRVIVADLGLTAFAEVVVKDDDEGIRLVINRVAEFDDTARGGGSEGLPIMRPGEPADAADDYESQANDALNHIVNDALTKLRAEIESRKLANAAELNEDLMLDAGPVWVHRPVPGQGLDLEDRLRAIQGQDYEVSPLTLAARFVDGKHIYLFGYYTDGRGSSAVLLRTELTGPGEISELESVDTEHLLGE